MVPVIQEPIIEEEPTHEPWEFTAVNEHTYLLSEKDLKVLSQYIIDLKVYAQSGWTWVDYYISELNEFNDSVSEYQN